LATEKLKSRYRVNRRNRAMALYQLDRSELNSLLISDNVDPSTRKAVIDLLKDDGDFKHHGTVQVQQGDNDPTMPGFQVADGTQVLILDTPHATIADTSNLEVIVDLPSAGDLTVTSGPDTGDLFIAHAELGSGPGKSHGHGHGFGLGNDKDHGHGYAFGHDHDHGHNTLSGSSGSDMHGLLGHNEGHDTVFGGFGGGTSHGNSLLNTSIDTVSGSLGNDTVSGGAGHQHGPFDLGSTGPTDPPHHGGTTIHFSGGQTTTTSGIEQLVFTDHHVTHH
jgi:hypothetical protein